MLPAPHREMTQRGVHPVGDLDLDERARERLRASSVHEPQGRRGGDVDLDPGKGCALVTAPAHDECGLGCTVEAKLDSLRGQQVRERREGLLVERDQLIGPTIARHGGALDLMRSDETSRPDDDICSPDRPAAPSSARAAPRSIVSVATAAYDATETSSIGL